MVPPHNWEEHVEAYHYNVGTRKPKSIFFASRKEWIIYIYLGIHFWAVLSVVTATSARMVVINTSRRQRRHISFPGVAVPLSLAAMAILSLVWVMLLGTRFAAQSSNGDMYLPAYFHSNHISSSYGVHPRITFLEVESGGHLRRKSDGQNRTIKMSKAELKAQQRLIDSDDFSYRDPLTEGK